MINAAMFPTNPNNLNDFTRVLLDKIIAAGPDTSVEVILRNGTTDWVRYDAAELQFHNFEYSRVWRLDGSSITRTQLDIVEIDGV